MKVAPVFRELASREGIRQTLVHTGQHYDAQMSDVFFQQLGIPEPHANLAVGSESHACQTANIMVRFESVVLKHRPDWVLVYGDVNSTVAASLVCAKLWIKLAHVEAGLRSFDRSMPEEINRLVTDQLADLLFTVALDGNENLAREGISPTKIHFVGNVMIDTLVRMLPAARASASRHTGPYALVTLHRPGNVDDIQWLKAMLEALHSISDELPILFPLHPRTRKRLEAAGALALGTDKLRFLDPLPYLEFLGLQESATVVITDSGGIQEETTFLGVPCLTVRESTERPVTVECGTNVLVGRDVQRLRCELEKVFAHKWKSGKVPSLWDGKAAERIADVLANQSTPSNAASAASTA
jgi:UDP-N-acetylglucosamine 2-epimerase (non-hydrolysing)